MIMLTRLNRQVFYLNPDLIETVEETPDTVITLVNGRKYISLESAADIVDEVTRFRGKIQRWPEIG